MREGVVNMQNQEKISKKEASRVKIKGRDFLLGLHKSLKDRDASEVKARARGVAVTAIIFCFSYLVSGREMALDTYPLGIAAICGVGRYYPAAFMGAMLGGIVGKIGWEYIFSLVRFSYLTTFRILDRRTRKYNRPYNLI